MTVLAVAEHRRGELRDVSHEVATAGRELADATGSELHLAVVGGDVELRDAARRVRRRDAR